MLRKRAGSFHKDQQMGTLTMSESDTESYSRSDFSVFNPKTTSIFNVPGVFVGLSPKGMSDSDSVRSPTSPLDFRLLSGLGYPTCCKSPRSSRTCHQKNWDFSKVGLSIVNSLDDNYDDSDIKNFPKVLRTSESKNILFGSKVRVKTTTCQVNTNSFETPKSLPGNFAIFPHSCNKSPLEKGSSDVVFEIGEALVESDHSRKLWSCSLDSCKAFSTLSRFANRSSSLECEKVPSNNVATRVAPLHFSGGSLNSNNSMDLNLPPADSLSASEIELSEDYTCVISHGPNPKKTHIYGDCILECYSDEGKEIGMLQDSIGSTVPSLFPSNDFLKFCHHCNKNLEGGKDIYIYRGEKAFCSSSCRLEAIMIDEKMEKTTNKSSTESSNSDMGGELCESCIFDTS